MGQRQHLFDEHPAVQSAVKLIVVNLYLFISHHLWDVPVNCNNCVSFNVHYFLSSTFFVQRNTFHDSNCFLTENSGIFMIRHYCFFFTDTSRMELLYAFLLSCIICSLLVLSITALNYFKIVPSSVSRKLTHICKLLLFLITLIVMGAVFTLCWILFPDQTQSKYVAASRTSFRLERIGSSSNIVLHCSALPVLAPLRSCWLRPH